MITENNPPQPLNTWNEYHSAINQVTLLQHRRRYNDISDNDLAELDTLSARCREFLQSKPIPELL